MARSGHLFEWPEHGPDERCRLLALLLEWSVQARQESREGGATGKQTGTGAYEDVSANEGAKRGYEDEGEAKEKRYRR
jgi:hypothetical protein